MTTTRPRQAPGIALRAVVALPLGELHGPADGQIEPPRHLWWSGGAVVNLDNPGEAAIFYESALDTGSAEDLAAWLNADLLASLWPSLGMTRVRQAAWEAANPRLVVPAVAA